MQPLGEGARQRRRMDAAKPLGLNSLHSILNSIPIMQALGESPTKGAG